MIYPSNRILVLVHYFGPYLIHTCALLSIYSCTIFFSRLIEERIVTKTLQAISIARILSFRNLPLEVDLYLRRLK